MDKFVILLPLIPIISALLTHLFSNMFGRYVIRISLVGSVLAFLLSLVLLTLYLSGEHGELGHVQLSEHWRILLLDPLSLIMSVLIAGISLLVRFYSVRYMIEESGYRRFFVLLDLMTAVLLLMVSAGDLITLLISWHLVGILLYFLLGHDTKSHTAYRYGFWTFITYRIGDIPLVIAAVLLFHVYGTWSLIDIFGQMEQDPTRIVETALGTWRVTEVVTGLIALAAFARSAQFLLHTWLPYTMEGPTPVSALMHAGIVNAGGFLITRFAPAFAHTEYILHWVFIVGFITAIAGSVLMLSQNDIKKALGYSTMGQMGFMVMECGVGAFSLAIFHLIAHGLFKGTLFLNSGGIIGDARRNDDVPKKALYRFIIEKQATGIRKPWLWMAIITVVVPAMVLALSHLYVDPNLFNTQGALVLLFFGWMTGAQVIFATYHLSTGHSFTLILKVILSFIVIVIGYTLISHAFTLFLFPNGEADLLYKAADISEAWFTTLALMTVVIIVFGWLAIYYADKNGVMSNQKLMKFKTYFYALLSREFHIADMYSYFTRGFLSASSHINTWLKWG